MIEHHGVTVDSLIALEFDIFELARKATPIMNSDGQPIMARDLASANQALENIGKLAGLWIERREVVTRPRTEAELRAELKRIEVEIAKRQRVSNCGRPVVDMTAKQPD